VGDTVDERAIFVKGPVVLFKWRNAPGWPVEYASPNVVEVFGYSAQAFLSGEISYGELIEPMDGERVAREVAAASESGAKSFVHEPYRIRARDGSVRWLYDFTQLLRDPEGNVTHYQGYVIDTTERVIAQDEARELERRLFHSQKLESLGVLAGGVAHDFNNLLTGILGQASLAKRRLGQSPEGLAEALDQIEILSRRAADLTRQLLAYSGKGTFVIGPVDLGEVVRELRGMLEVVIPKKASLELELGAIPKVLGDRAQLQQVVMNLLTNAAEALGDNVGAIRLRTQIIEQTAESLAARGASSLQPGRYVSLEVEDSGCGMTEEVRERLFDPFFTTKTTGRGLGMSAVLGIVRGHKGHIEVRSTPGRGTTFQLLLPPTNERAREALPEVDARKPGVGTLLVVDDEASIRQILKVLLGYLGYQVLLAENGAQALELYQQHASEIVLVLMDMTMPVMSGPEALRLLRAQAPTLPIVLSSGFSEHDAARSLGCEQATAFLQKPYDTAEIERVITTALSKTSR
jgi:PAS domain S-box-containing protein